MERRLIRTSTIEELLSILEKDYGPNWYDKMTIDITESAGQIEAVVKPIQNVDPRTAFERISSAEIKTAFLPDLSDIQQKHSQPSIVVELSQDKMSAKIIIIPGFERIMPTLDEIRKALSDSQIVYGIDEETIMSAIKEQKIFTEICVARGKEPIPSKDACVEFLFPESGFVCEKQEEDERFDPASFYKIFTCKRGDVLAIKIPAQYGEDGFTVTGETVKAAKPKEINLASFAGENVVLSDDGNKIVATCDGQPYLKNGKVNVRSILLVEGDLGYDTGNIDFNASVVIRGNAEGPSRSRLAEMC